MFPYSPKPVTGSRCNGLVSDFEATDFVSLRACSHGGGVPGIVRYPIYPRSEYPGLHMQPRGAGVKCKMLSRGR